MNSLHWIDKYPHLLRGIKDTLLGGQEWQGFAGYQQKWEQMIYDPPGHQIAWLANRFAAKSFTTALALFRRMTREPGLRITCIPGGKLEQAKVAMRYMKCFSRYLRGLRRHPWTAKKINLRNLSSFSIEPPTEKAVQGERANIIWIDEAQLMDRQIYELLLYQAMSHNMLIILTGTPEYPSAYHDTWHNLPSECKLETRWYEAVDAGIISQESAMALKGEVSDESWRAMMECEWVRKDNYVFEPTIVTTFPPHGKNNIGIDCNLYPGLVWVKVVKHGDKYIAVDEGVLKHAQNADTLEASKITIESNGANMGFVPHVREHAKVSVYPNDWGGNKKQHQIERMKILNDRNKLEIHESCPLLIDSIENLVFKKNGKIDKDNSPNVHYFDAWVHGVIGLESSGGGVKTMKVIKGARI